MSNCTQQLVACLAFASRVLPSTLAQVATKQALATIVVDVHQFVVSTQGFIRDADAEDPRRLLEKFQARSNQDEVVDDALLHLQLTDFSLDGSIETVVRRTYERAMQSKRSVCLIFVAERTSQLSTETGVVWIPFDEAIPEQRVLLFFAPARVKVIKGINEAIKRMQQDIAGLDSADTKLRTWVLTRLELTSSDIEQHLSENVLTNDIQHETEATSPTCDISEHEPQVQSQQESERSNIPKSKAPPRQHKSIFCFSVEATKTNDAPEIHPTSRSPVCNSPQQTKESSLKTDSLTNQDSDRIQTSHQDFEYLDAVSRSTDAVSPPVEQNEDPFASSFQCAPVTQQRRAKHVLSRSCAVNPEKRYRSGVSDEEPMAVWRSLNSNIIKKKMLCSVSQGRGQPIEIEGKSMTEATISEDIVDVQYNELSVENEQHEVQPNCSATTSPWKPFAPAPNKQSLLGDSDHAENHDNAYVECEDAALVSIETSVMNAKKPSIRDTYKSKLGARVWFELEYQAAKILQREASIGAVRVSTEKQTKNETRHSSPARPVSSERQINMIQEDMDTNLDSFGVRDTAVHSNDQCVGKANDAIEAEENSENSVEIVPQTDEEVEVQAKAVDLEPLTAGTQGRIPIRYRSAPTTSIEPPESVYVLQHVQHQHVAIQPAKEPEQQNSAVALPEETLKKSRGMPAPMTAFVLLEPADESKRARQDRLAQVRQQKFEQRHHTRPPDQSARPKECNNGASHSVVDARVGVPLPMTEDLAEDTTARNPQAQRLRKCRPSNRKLIHNAIEYTLLAGMSLQKDRQAALAAIADSPCDNFVVLLKSAQEFQFRALYEHHVGASRIQRIYTVTANAPMELHDELIAQFFRYNSGKKEFMRIDARSFTVKTDGCALDEQCTIKRRGTGGAHRAL